MHVGLLTEASTPPRSMNNDDNMSQGTVNQAIRTKSAAM